MNTRELIAAEKQTILGTYTRPEFVITHGKDVYLYDAEGREYLDFVSGIAVNAFGYSDTDAKNALTEQSEKLWHCSNLYYTEPQVKLAQFLVKHTFADKLFFCNSGTEAMEAAIKFARKWASLTKGSDNYQILAFNRSFHGRTYGGLSATGQPKFWEHFGPMLEGFDFAEFNDIESVKIKITDKTCAVIVEPVQGEGGIYPADVEFLKQLRTLCDEHNTLLILDEIQCGFGRTGHFCAYEGYGILPDILTAAKPIAGGLPLGAVLLTDKIAEHIKPGDHGTTFGGGPIVTSVALNILERIAEPAFLESVRDKGSYLQEQLSALQTEYPELIAVRSKGLMFGLEIQGSPQDLIKACTEQGLLICKTGGNAVRFLPPLIITKEQIDEGLNKFKLALDSLRG